MTTAKQQAIINAYGEFWEKVKDFVDEDGWIKFSDDKEIIRYEYHSDGNIMCNPLDINKWRPKQLAGIENNNGWIKIESEADLPEETTECHFINKNNKIIYCGTYHYKLIEFRCGIIHLTFDKVTHYQPIQKPLQPIY